MSVYVDPPNVADRAEALARKLDQKLNVVAGFPANDLTRNLENLLQFGSVEVGWRESCGSTDRTLKVYREWVKVVAAIKRSGLQLSEQRVLHKNRYASNNGGFWSSIIYRLPAAPALQTGGQQQ